MVTINVTQKHIDSSIGGAQMCPIALAVKEHLDTEKFKVFVSSTTVEIINAHSYAFCCLIKHNEREFVQAYDSHAWVKPFQFELDIPPLFLKTPSEEGKQP